MKRRDTRGTFGGRRDDALDLVEVWFRRQESGDPVDLEELCSEQPELLPPTLAEHGLPPVWVPSPATDDDPGPST